jgi:hypothetical protein
MVRALVVAKCPRLCDTLVHTLEHALVGFKQQFRVLGQSATSTARIETLGSAVFETRHYVFAAGFSDKQI